MSEGPSMRRVRTATGEYLIFRPNQTKNLSGFPFYLEEFSVRDSNQ